MQVDTEIVHKPELVADPQPVPFKEAIANDTNTEDNHLPISEVPPTKLVQTENGPELVTAEKKTGAKAAPWKKISKELSLGSIGRKKKKEEAISPLVATASAKPVVKHKKHKFAENQKDGVKAAELTMKDKVLNQVKSNIFIQHVLVIPVLMLLSWIFTGILVWTAFLGGMIFLSLKQVKQAKENLYVSAKESYQEDQIYEKVQDVAWLNQVVAKYWCTCVPSLVLPHVERMSNIMTSNKPSFVHKMEVGKWSIGKKGPRLYQVYTPNIPSNHKYQVDCELMFTPDFSMEFRIEPIKKICVKILLSNLVFKGRVRMHLHFKDEAEDGIANISISFIGEPQIAFAIKPLGSVDMLSLPKMYEWIDQNIKSTLKPLMVWPQQLQFSIGGTETVAEHDKEIPITDIAIIQVQEQHAPPGYNIINRTLNHNTPACFVQQPNNYEFYLCYERDPNKPPITDVAVICAKDEQVPEGFIKVEKTHFGQLASLNTSVPGNEMFICYRKQPGAPPITGLGVHNEHDAGVAQELYTMVDATPSGHRANLNKKNKGPRFFLAYRGGSGSNFGYSRGYLNPNEGLLRVHLSEGRNIKVADANGFSDPYCVLTLGGNKAKKADKLQSRVIDKCLTPVWHETFLMHATVNDVLTITCYDHDLVGKDDFLGKLQLPLNTLVCGKAVTQWYDLEMVSTGEILVSITALDFGLPPDHPSPPLEIVPIECTKAHSKFGALLPGGENLAKIKRERALEKERQKAKETEVKQISEVKASLVECAAAAASLNFVDKAGHLDKLPTKAVLAGITNQSWQRRWIVLDKHKLVYYRSSKDPAANMLGAVTLKNAELAFNPNDAELVFTVGTKAKQLTFRAASVEEFKEWYILVNNNITVASNTKSRLYASPDATASSTDLLAQQQA